MYCPYCLKFINEANPDFCPHCGENLRRKVKKNRGVLRKVFGVVLGILGALMVLSALSAEPSIDAPQMTAAEYAAICREISYEDLARNPESHKGEYFKFTGEVIQVMESSGRVDLRINVTRVSFYDGLEDYADLYGDLTDEEISDASYYQDTIFATAKLKDNGDRILEGDIIEFYGVCQGLYKYISVLGAEVSLPEIDIGYWKIVK